MSQIEIESSMTRRVTIYKKELGTITWSLEPLRISEPLELILNKYFREKPKKNRYFWKKGL